LVPQGKPLWTCYAKLNEYPEDFNEDLARRLDGYVAQLRKHELSKLTCGVAGGVVRLVGIADHGR